MPESEKVSEKCKLYLSILILSHLSNYRILIDLSLNLTNPYRCIYLFQQIISIYPFIFLSIIKYSVYINLSIYSSIYLSIYRQNLNKSSPHTILLSTWFLSKNFIPKWLSSVMGLTLYISRLRYFQVYFVKVYELFKLNYK